MPSFEPDVSDRAFQLARNSAVTLFWRKELLDETAAWLTEHGYRLARLEAKEWTTQADFHAAVSTALDFPDYYGHNLDAFNDCLRDVAYYEYGADRDATGTIIVLTGYDAFTRHEPKAAQVILDIIASNARLAMLIGHRLLCLVQSDDPEPHFDPVGATPVTWNPAESFRADRR